jgi:3-phosphoshikimate 1-carboxyvinyltransferase
MGFFLVKGPSCIKGEISFPGDKSIAHRSVILSALSQGKTTIQNFPANADCLSTIKAFRKLGIKITGKLKVNTFNTINVFGKGLRGLAPPKKPLFIGDSGTTFRLLLGVLAGQNFKIKLVAGKSLSKRPMLRVAHPLRLMGATITARPKPVNSLTLKPANAGNPMEEYPPISILGAKLEAITYKIPVASAQVKSAILLAALYTNKITKVIEPIKTRDHTERMLKLFKANIKVKGNNILIKGDRELVCPGKIYIPGDLSSAGFFIVLACILSNSEILIKNVNLNPSRMGIVKVLKRMGAVIKVKSQKSLASRDPALDRKLKRGKGKSAEPIGDILVKSSRLKGTMVKKEEIPSLIDELPVLMVAACFARGRSVFEGVGELRVKETDRIRSMVDNLQEMGADIKVKSQKSPALRDPAFDRKLERGKVKTVESIIIKGVLNLKGSRVKSFGDHRIAMSMIVAALMAKGKTVIDDISCINKSFPGFLSVLNQLIVKK